MLTRQARAVKANAGVAPYVSARIPPNFWVALAEWLAKLKWTIAASHGALRAACSMSWLELTILFRLESGFNFDRRDLKDWVAMMAAAFRKLSKVSDGCRVKTAAS